jgi:hypothetical protein
MVRRPSLPGATSRALRSAITSISRLYELEAVACPGRPDPGPGAGAPSYRVEPARPGRAQSAADPPRPLSLRLPARERRRRPLVTDHGDRRAQREATEGPRRGRPKPETAPAPPPRPSRHDSQPRRSPRPGAGAGPDPFEPPGRGPLRTSFWPP